MSDNTNLAKVVETFNEQMDAAMTVKKFANEVMLVFPPQAPCLEMLLPAPLAICLIGKLQLISNNNDFNLREPKDGFKHIRWDSFRASFMQVGHTMQDAFRLCDKNMNAIHLRSSQLPKSFERAVMLIMKQFLCQDKTFYAAFLFFQVILPFFSNKTHIILFIQSLGSGGLFEAPYNALSIPLQQIKNDTEFCLKMAQEVENKYVLVTDMTAELLEATLAKEKDTNDELKRIEKTRDALKEIEKIAQLEKQENEKRLNELKQYAKDANEMFKKMFEDSDNLIMKHAILESVTGLIKYASSTIIPALMLRKATVSQAVAATLPAGIEIGKEALAAMSTKNEQTGAQSKQAQDVDDFEEIIETEHKDAKQQVAKMEAYGKAKDVLKLASDLMAFVKDDDTFSDEAIATNQEASTLVYFRELKRSLSEASRLSQNARHLLDLCGKEFFLYNCLQKLHQEPGGVKINELIKDIKKLYHNCKEFAAKAQLRLGCTCFDNSAHDKIKRKLVTVSQMNATIDLAHFKLEQSLSYLKYKEQQVDEVEEKRKQLLDKIAARAQQIKQCNIEDVNYRNIRACLLQVLDVLSQLREQWEYLVRFFQSMSSLLDVALNTSLSFNTYSQEQVKSPEHGYLREIIYQQAFEAMKIGIVVRQLSGCYSEMSKLYLMPQVGALDRLFSARATNELAAADSELLYQQSIAETGMKVIIDKGRQEICIAIKDRMLELKKIKDSLEPNMSAEAVLKNQQSVQSAFSAIDDAENDDIAATSKFTL